MKRVSQMTALAMALGLACASSWAAELAKPLTLDLLQQQNGKAIDTRPSAFYNGWPQTLNGPSGHEPAALNLSASWLDKMSTEQLNAWIKQHNLKADAPVALYGNDKDVDAVKTRLQKAGFTHISILSDALANLPVYKNCRTLSSWFIRNGCTTCNKVKRLRRNLPVTGKSLKRPGRS